MKHIAHLILFDLKGAKSLIAVWGGVLITQAVVLAVGPGPVDTVNGPNPIAIDFGILIVRAGVAIAFAAIIVQRDLLVGTTAFWRTRPASRVAMMVSKLASLLLVLVLLPAAVMALLLLFLGLWPADALAGAVSVAAEQVVIVGLTLPVAVVTANLAHFAIAAAGTLAITGMLAAYVLPSLFSVWPGLRIPVGFSPTAAMTAVLLVGTVSALVNQFLTLRTRRSVAVIIAVVLLAAFTGRLPKAATNSPGYRAVDGAVLGPDRLTVHVDPESILTETVSVIEPSSGAVGRKAAVYGTWKILRRA